MNDLTKQVEWEPIIIDGLTEAQEQEIDDFEFASCGIQCVGCLSYLEEDF